MSEEKLSGEISGSVLTSMYVSIKKIREFEERLAELLVTTDEVKCPCHLYIGQEAVAAGVCAALEQDDYVFGTHRSHGYYLAKGGDMNAMMAEIYGRSTGCSRGRGGSMHLVAPECGVLGSPAIVSAGIPLAVGAALASWIRGDHRIAVPFFGDGATDEGVFHESLNFAALNALPVVFVVENNLYSTHMHINYRKPHDRITDHAALYGIPAERLDGNDACAVYRAAGVAVARARAGEGPTLLECMTYRWRGHVGPNLDIDKGLRSRDELERWMNRCPVQRARTVILEDGILGADELDSLDGDIIRQVEAAFDFARRSPLPPAREVEKYVFEKGAVS